MFVKTLNYPGLWGTGCKTTPGRWAIELGMYLKFSLNVYRYEIGDADKVWIVIYAPNT